MTVSVTNAMTVDVEDYFQVSAFEKNIKREDWENIPTRVEENTDRILELFSTKNIKATFFILGWIAEKHPQLVGRISDAGHEVASHGYEHTRVIFQQPNEFLDDITRTKKILEDCTGKIVSGYRAASFSINLNNLWALDSIHEAGYQYSSSIYPVHHDLYGIPKAPRTPFKCPETGLLEIPVTTARMGKHNYPAGGGGYFRLFPYSVFQFLLNKVVKGEKQSAIFYFHPWEIDPQQPKQENIGLKTRIRHYTNLGKMENKLSRLLIDYNWSSIEQVFLNKEYPVFDLHSLRDDLPE